MKRRNFDEDDSALDEHGVLRDQHSARVPLMMRDAASVTPVQRAIAADSAVHWRDAADAHFGRAVKVTAGDGSTRGLHKPGFRVDRRVATDERAECYRLYDEEIGRAYKRDAGPPGSYPYSAGAEGGACTVDGQAGRLVRQGDVLVCQPVRRAGPRDHQLVMDAEYQRYEASLREAWRHGGR
jgi:hypothetical protein